MPVSFDLSHPDFLSKLGLLAATDPSLHNSLLVFLAASTGMELDDFIQQNDCCIHNAPHFFANSVFGHFVPNKTGPFEIYVEMETSNALLTGHMIPVSFWRPRYLR